jgi:hypothetical protein
MEPAQLPFPTMRFEESRYQVFGVVSNRSLPGAELIRLSPGALWQERSGPWGDEVRLGRRAEALGAVRG